MTNRYILTLSCNDVKGIVATVSGFLLEHDGFIIESAQYGDAFTKNFFLRMVFESGKTLDKIKQSFTPIAEKFSMDWELSDPSIKPKLLLMVSNQSHCFNDILHRYSTGNLAVEIPAIISNHNKLEKMAKWYDVPFHHLPVTKETKPQQEQQIKELIASLDIDLVVLARYMQILSPDLADSLSGKAINIHHSFLPSFKGAKPYHQAHEKGVKLIGATAHYINNKLDEGPIIDQEVIRVDHTNTPEQLVELGCDIENQVLSRAVKYHIERRVLLNGNKTVIFK